MELLDRIRAIRQAERLTQAQFCELTGISKQTLKNYEQRLRSSAASDQLEKIVSHVLFKKYAYWLLTGEILPESGQINPEIENERLKQNLPDTPDGYRVAYESINAGSDEKTA